MLSHLSDSLPRVRERVLYGDSGISEGDGSEGGGGNGQTTTALCISTSHSASPFHITYLLDHLLELVLEL